jgi:opacity protein-like surface antigen
MTTIMKRTTKIATLAIVLFSATSGVALGNGTEPMPEPQQAPQAPAQAYEQPPMPKPEPAPTVSNAGPYVSGMVGAAISGENDVKDGYLLNAAAGYNFDPGRVELALGYQHNGLKDVGGHLSYWSLMANAYYDIETGMELTPYLMGGVGATQSHYSPTGDNRNNFAWQLGAGVGVDIAENTTFDLGYRYFDPSDGVVNFSSHNIVAGIRYQF